MRHRERKLSKLDTIRKVIRGELPLSALLSQQTVVFVNHLENGTVEVGGEVYTAEEWEEKKKELDASATQWNEKKIYMHGHPVVPGMEFYSEVQIINIRRDSRNEPLISSKTSIDEQPKQIKPVIEPQEVVNDCPAEVEPTPKDSRKERMNLKKLEAQHIREIMLERKIQMDNFTKMNTDFLPGWFQ